MEKMGRKYVSDCVLSPSAFKACSLLPGLAASAAAVVEGSG